MSVGSGPLQSSPVLITQSKQESGKEASTAVSRDDWGSHATDALSATRTQKEKNIRMPQQRKRVHSGRLVCSRNRAVGMKQAGD